MRSPVPKRLFAFQNYSTLSPQTVTLQFPPLLLRASIHGYLVLAYPHSPTFPSPCRWTQSTHDFRFLSCIFDGGAFRDLGVGGAGAILWLHNQGRSPAPLLLLHPPPTLHWTLPMLKQLVAAYAVLLAGRYLPNPTPLTKIIIKGDKPTQSSTLCPTLVSIDVRTYKQLLEGAQHNPCLLSPRTFLWSYTPREFKPLRWTIWQGVCQRLRT